MPDVPPVVGKEFLFLLRQKDFFLARKDQNKRLNNFAIFV